MKLKNIKDKQVDNDTLEVTSQLEMDIADLENLLEEKYKELEILQYDIINLENELSNKISLKEKILHPAGD